MAQPNSTLTAALNRISERRFLLVHQSVGRDMLHGVKGISHSVGAPCPPLIDVKLGEPVEDKGIPHARLGRNRGPDTKFAAFSELMAGPLGQDADVACVKLCYVDVHESTDVQALFDRYRRALETAAEHAPATRVFAMTVRPTTVQGALSARMRRLLGRRCPQREADLRRRTRAMVGT